MRFWSVLNHFDLLWSIMISFANFNQFWLHHSAHGVVPTLSSRRKSCKKNYLNFSFSEILISFVHFLSFLSSFDQLDFWLLMFRGTNLHHSAHILHLQGGTNFVKCMINFWSILIIYDQRPFTSHSGHTLQIQGGTNFVKCKK